jgi:N-acetylmuramoyl-L-alanine amidase
MHQPVDSFQVYQPNTDLIQLSIYSQHIDTTDIYVPNSPYAFDEISFYDIPAGVGVDVYIKQGKYFEGVAYHDVASDDLLLGLTEADKTELEYVTKDMEPIIWSRFTVSEESLLVGDAEFDTTYPGANIYQNIKDKMRFDVVVIDPGHGGHDPGSIGYRGVKEKDVALQIAKKVGGYINEYIPDVEVVYTRGTDQFVDLYERGPIANRAEGDLFVSIHANKHYSRQANGTETYFLGPTRTDSALQVMQRENTVVNRDNSRVVAEISQEELIIYELTNSGYMATSEKIAGMVEHQFDERAKRHSRGVKQAGFVVLYTASMPGILVETGFLSNPSEARYLTSDYGQSIIASAIFRAIRNYKEEYEKSQHYNTK